jgi:hypothetical protein
LGAIVAIVNQRIAPIVSTYTRHRGRVKRYARREGVMEGFEFVRGVAGRLPRA